MSVPNRIQNGVGQLPDASELLANFDFLEALLHGNLLSNGGMEAWNNGTSFADLGSGTETADDWTYTESGTSDPETDIDREGTTIDTGTYSMKMEIVTAGSADSVITLDQSVPEPVLMRGLSLAFGMRVKVATASKVRLKITDGTTTAYSSYHTGSGSWESLQAVVAVASGATAVTVTVEVRSDFEDEIYLDSGYLYRFDPNMNTTARQQLAFSALLGRSLPIEGGSLTGDLGLQSINNSFIGYGRNRVVNGAMRFDQRNEGASNYSGTSNAPTLDCWRAFASGGGEFTIARSTSSPPTGFTHHQALTVTTNDASVGAAEYYYIEHRVEGNRVRDFFLGGSSAKTFTVSFWVQSSVTGEYSIAFQNSAANRSYVTTYTINAASTWEFKTVTIAGDTSGTWLTDTGVGLRVIFDLGLGSNYEGTADAWQASAIYRKSTSVRWIGTNSATFNISGVQVETGSRASEFEYLPDGVELGIIQRYLEKSYVQGTAVTTNTGTNRTAVAFAKFNTNSMLSTGVPFKNEKVAAPTVTLYTESGTSGQWDFLNTSGGTTARSVSVNAAGTKDFEVAQAVAEEYLGRGHWIATAEL